MSADQISQITLTLAGILSFLIGGFHVILMFNTELSRVYGAPTILLENRTLMFIAGSLMTGLCVVWGLYALAGAEYIGALPLLRPALLVIGLVLTLRGLALMQELAVNLNWIGGRDTYPSEEIGSSTVALVTGLLYLVGLAALFS